MRNTVTAKLGTMRKEQKFMVMPFVRKDGTSLLMIQSGKSVGLIDYKTGRGKLYTKGSYGVHLALAQPFDYPPEFVAECLKACPSLGGKTDIGGVVVQHNIVEI